MSALISPSTSAAAVFVDEVALRTAQHDDRERLILLGLRVIVGLMLVAVAAPTLLVFIGVAIVAVAAVLSSPAATAIGGAAVLALTLFFTCGGRRSSTSSGQCVSSSH